VLVIDAGCDENYAFEDLGNAVRKIRVDLGVSITFRGFHVGPDQPSASGGATRLVSGSGRYVAIGDIQYSRRDPSLEDGKLLYVTSEVASLVHVIDTASGKVVKNVKVGKRPRRMAITPDGKELWVTCELGAAVSIVSTVDNSVLATLKFEVKGARSQDITPVGIQMSRDGRRAFVALGRANHVAFVDVAARKVTDLVLVGKRAWNVALDKDEKRLFVVNGLSDDLTVVDVAGAKPIKTVPVGRVPYGVVIVE